MTVLGNRVGLDLYGPVEVRRALKNTNDRIEEINKEVTTAEVPSPVFRAKWADLYRDWQVFFKGKLGPGGVISNLRDSTYERTMAFDREALKFKYALIEAATAAAKAKEAGGTEGTNGAKGSGGSSWHLPDVHLPHLDLPSLLSFPWQPIVYAGAAILGGLVVVRIVTRRS